MQNIESIYEDLVISSKPTVKHLELSDVYDKVNQMRELARTAVSDMQERAMKNIQARDQLAVQLGELNAIEGADSEKLSTETEATINTIDNKVKEDGHWVYADTIVSKAATEFATNKKVKHILRNKALYDAYIAELEKQTDADPTYMALAKAKALKDYNDNGGAFAADGSEQSFSSFAYNLGKGHDMKEYREEILKTFEKLKPDSGYMYSDGFKRTLIEIANNPNASNELKEIAQNLTTTPLYYFQGNYTEQSGVSKDKLMKLAQYIVLSDNKFNMAMNQEAELLLFANEEKGISAGDMIRNNMFNSLLNNPSSHKQIITLTDEYIAADDKRKQELLANPDLISSSSIEKAANKLFSTVEQGPNETYEEYNERMKTTFTDTYRQDKVNGLLGYASELAYTNKTGKINTTILDKLITDSIKRSVDKSKDLKIAYSAVNSADIALAHKLDNEYNISNREFAAQLKQKKALILEDKTISDDEKDKLIIQLDNDLKNIDTDNIIFNNKCSEAYFNRNVLERENILSDFAQNFMSEAMSYGGPLNTANNNQFILFKPDSPLGMVMKDFKSAVKQLATSDIPLENIMSSSKDILISLLNARKLDYNIYKIDSIIQTKGYNLFHDALGDNEIYISSDRGFTFGTNDNLDSFANKSKNALTDYIQYNKGVFDVSAMQLKKDGKHIRLEEDSDLVDVPVTEGDKISRFFRTIAKGSKDEPRFDFSQLNVDCVGMVDGTYQIRLSKKPQGDSDVTETLILRTKDSGAIEAINKYKNDLMLNAYANTIENKYDTASKNLLNKMYQVEGASINLTFDMTNDTKRNASDMFDDGQVINGNVFKKIGAALDYITSTPSISEGNFTLYPNGNKVEIIKYKDGTYNVKHYILNGNGEYTLVSKKVSGDRYLNSEDFKAGLLADLGEYKNIDMLKNRYIPSYEYRLRYGL